MSGISRRRLLRATGGLTAAAAAGWWAAGCTDDGAAGESDDNLGFAGVVLGEPLSKPTIAFTDTSGAPYDLAAETAGRLTLMLFGYTSCPDVCPTHLFVLSNALDKLSGPASKAKVIFVGVDTERDTPSRMREFLDQRNPDFVGLTAPPADIDRALAQLELPAVVIEPKRDDGSYVVGHPSQILAITPDDRCHIVYRFGVLEQQWVKDLPRLLTYEWPDTRR